MVFGWWDSDITFRAGLMRFMTIFAVAITSVWVSPALGQPALILSVGPADADQSPPPTVNATYPITLNFDHLKHAPAGLVIELPNGISFTAQRSEFAYRSGYVSSTPWDPPGTPPVYPNPLLPNGAFSYKWAGRDANHEVVLTVDHGRMLGVITGTRRFVIEPVTPDGYRLIDVNSEAFPVCAVGEAPLAVISNPVAEPPHQQMKIDTIRAVTPGHFPDSFLGAGTLNFVDLLVPWTEQARIDAGGASNDPNDTDNIYDLIQAAIDHANTALINSQTDVRVSRYITARLSNFPLTGDPRADLEWLRNNPYVQSLRLQTGSDAVVTMIQNYEPGVYPACGNANVQTIPGCGSNGVGCGAGSSYKAFAYALVSVECAIWDDTFGHELGHMMGGNHLRWEVGSADVAAITSNGFPDAFAKQVAPTFTSLVTSNRSPPRRLYFSNPNVLANGVATGDLGTKNNARVIDQLTPAMENYYARPEVIFVDGFE